MPDDPHERSDDQPTADSDPEGPDARAEEAFVGEPEIPSAGLLSFYDRLRERIIGALGDRGGKFGEGTATVLLLVPDIFILMVRLALDKEVPSSARALIGGALAYFILPMDLLPEALVGVGGYVDDLVLATAVLSQTFGGELEPLARKHWSGPEDIRVVLRDISMTAKSLLGESLYERLKQLLAKRGIDFPEEGAGSGPEPSSGGPGPDDSY